MSMSAISFAISASDVLDMNFPPVGLEQRRDAGHVP
jgi:hypothetical protein